VDRCGEPVLCRIVPWLFAWRAFVFRPGRCPFLARARSGKIVSLPWRWLRPSTERIKLSGARAILKRFQLSEELKDKIGQRAGHNACSEGRTLRNRFAKAFESCLNEKSMEIDLSLTWKS
jgi:hypothetical protein